MKKFVLSIIIVAGGLLAQTANAQVGVNVGIRVGPLVINVHKPIAPAVMYDDYYYLPDVDAYYSVPENCYYYMDDDRRWVNARYLPGRYHDYDWRNARRYEVRAQRPYNNHDFYRNKFGGRRVDDWNKNNNQYANRGPERRNDRGYDRRFPDSPYDSNNAGGRSNNWNNRRDNDRGNGGNRGDDRNNSNWGQDRNQGGYPGRNNNQNDGRNNDQRNNQGRGNYGQPSNQNGDRNGRGDNQDRSYQQRYTQNNDRGAKSQFDSNRKMMF